ncbi:MULTISPECIES: hypothetical protein [Rhodoluna]|uniref:hypothetical protein n=1 Tax=Rhodoluna TaxID=529883 RepID=UPI001106CA09|nr:MULTISPECIES: hypothetical protein [Rhodoluna]BDS49239.1 hypothetical protein RKAS3_08160 [Rhodoluna sp. KAS3]
MSGEETSFPVVVRGYDRGLVDDALKDLRRDLMQLSAQNAQLAQELKEAATKRDQALMELAEAGDPSYTGVGARAALILSTAEDQARFLLAESNNVISKQRKELEAEVSALHGEAKGYYDSLVAEAQRRADRISAAARADYDEIINQAKNDAARVMDEAIREAGATRGSVATEAAKMRAAAKREVETLKSKVERDLAERKLLAFRENTRDLDLDYAQTLVTEQARIDLELELTARRAEAEAEYLRKHQEAVATTQKYLDDANAQLALALARASAARLEAETLEAAAISINQQNTEAARKKADAIMAAAEAEARKSVAEAQAEIDRRIAQSKVILERLQAERDSVEVYLKNLRNLFNGKDLLNPPPQSFS